ncbi:MAG: YbfB/YjiJ family MFS transporter [Alphaproteobacteria bacterium]|nr:YbfB/YjiJ family MFS transporter [Alphaproteobacteria bacterium]MBU0803351.1 YbfB/YjiJ family MFS transporter [Alphaproteobacteria bacterium]MBU0871887.1 YbfB/YjiJ family MFS transporter [Alphaproteobacteria bacterium]MBU1402280.1 YbfB/YjiJ family MFS transporter [Alphaproteobacteria bacterium]MBU1590925.1 YbfB/YjiJ family MFS transporter [Alphaproteobacteria bacterium]
MIAMAVAMGVGRFVYTPILPGMMQQLGLSAADAGLIASANYLGYLVGAILAAGGWAEGHERHIMLAGLGASALLAGAMGLADSLALFLAVRFLAGLASAFVMVFLASIVFSHLANARRSDLQALHFGGVGLGIASSSALMLFLIAAGTDWRGGWFGAAAISAAGFVAVAWLVDRGPFVVGHPRREPKLPDSWALRKVILAYGLFGLGYIVTATFLVAIVREGDGGRQFEAVVWLATGLAGFPSVFLWNRVANRIGLPSAYVLACIVEAAGVTASVATGGLAGPLVGGILLGATFIAATSLGLRLAQLMAPLSARRALALMTAAFGVGQIAGPVLAGVVAQWSGSFFLPSLGAAAALLASAAIVWSAERTAST